MKVSAMHSTPDVLPSIGRVLWILMTVSFVCFGVIHTACAATSEPNSISDRRATGRPDAEIEGADDFMDMSIEELMEVPITLVSKKDERSFSAPAAVYVITADDIRRSGHRSVPELLRLVPGIEVARINNNKWAITSRGFNALFSEKLLVMIDGRSVYTPLHSGVYWDIQDVLLEDIERIEVIRGPGGTLWGANAVNGVINVITKEASDTQGGLIAAGTGSEEKVSSVVRYGGKLSDNAHYRVSGKYSDRDDSIYSDGSQAFDGQDMLRQSFRVDWDNSPQDRLTFQGDFYTGCAQENTASTSLTPPYMSTVDDSVDLSGQNLSIRWRRDITETSGIALQAYFDRTKRDTLLLGETRNTYDLDFQHHFRLNGNHNVMWGLGYRRTGDKTDGSYSVSLVPSDREDDILSGFVQDEITLVEDRLKLILGSKFEDNDYTGFEYQPSGRLAWTPDERNTLWASVTRAVSTPSRFYSDVMQNYLVLNPAVVFSFTGSDDLDAQEVQAYEMGYRFKPKDELYIDVTGFYNEYDRLFALEYNPTVFTRIYDNQMYGQTYGGEVSAHWQVRENWRVTAGYSFLQMQLHVRESSTNTTAEIRYEDSSPHNSFRLVSYLDLPHNLELTTAIYYADTVPYYLVPSYVRLDLGLAWRVDENLELAIVGQNLFDPGHPEFSNEVLAATEIERAVYGELTYRF